MNISSTPFIRNDYWPDYNDINQLNQRIDDVESEIALVNIHLSSDIENVSANLNAYVNDQANTIITNNIVVNNLNANYAFGKYANFANTNTDNAYIENLTVNKPVFDITLNTPHLENTTSLDGNFYNPNLVNPKFVDLDTLELNNFKANTANIGNLFVNIQPAPISSSAVLGYDLEGRVIPIHATYDVGFPEDADYLFTDTAGTAFAGTAATEVGTTDNLITAYAVKNAIDEVVANVNDSFNMINNSLNDIDEWQNTFENDISNSFSDVSNNFNDVANTFNDVNAFVNDGFNNVNNSFNDVNNTFNDVNNYLSNTFANIDNNFNNSDNNFVNAANNFNDIYSVLSTMMSLSTSNAKVYSLLAGPASGNILITGNAHTIRFETPADTSGYNISSGASNPVFAKFVGTEVVFSSNLPILNTDVSMLRVFNTNMKSVFLYCSNLNQNILIPYGVTDMSSTFSSCNNLNQNLLIPNSVVNMTSTFSSCNNLNQNILIPYGVTDMTQTFSRCNSLDQNILIPNSVVYMNDTFTGCHNLNQNILIPNSVTSLSGSGTASQYVFGLFNECTSLNQDDMYIYSQNITSMANAFWNVARIGNIHVPTSVPKSTSNYMYNCLVNGNAGYTFAPENIINDLPVDIETWPPTV